MVLSFKYTHTACVYHTHQQRVKDEHTDHETEVERLEPEDTLNHTKPVPIHNSDGDTCDTDGSTQDPCYIPAPVWEIEPTEQHPPLVC